MIQESHVNIIPTLDSFFYSFSPLDNTIVPLKDPLLWDQHLLDPLSLIQQQLQWGP